MSRTNVYIFKYGVKTRDTHLCIIFFLNISITYHREYNCMLSTVGALNAKHRSTFTRTKNVLFFAYPKHMDYILQNTSIHTSVTQARLPTYRDLNRRQFIYKPIGVTSKCLLLYLDIIFAARKIIDSSADLSMLITFELHRIAMHCDR